MLFNSIEFAIFLPIVFFLYWFVFKRSLKAQNALIIAASYLFYGWWDPRFLILIIVSSAVDFVLGKRMHIVTDKIKRKRILWLSLGVNLGFLFFFKYFNFFIHSFIASFASIGVQINEPSLKIILPVGISFYTFQTLSYTIDIYKKKLEPTNDPLAFFAFVSFFPQLVAGPIERAKNLLPQFYDKRKFSFCEAEDGIRQILWGLIKKVVIADNAAVMVDQIFSNYDQLGSATLVLGAVFFAFQIYGDFSGYSDIAIGTARLFGFNLMQNFAFPYFSRDIAEFWRRWHISLSSWFRDYVYIPLGGSYGGKWSRIRNIIITFTVSGLWHGANWTYVFWGFLNGLYYIPLMLMNKQKKNTSIVAENRYLPSFVEFGSILLTFSLTILAWVFFRSESLSQAFDYITRIFRFSHQEIDINYINFVYYILVFVLIEWIQRRKTHGLQIEKMNIVFRWILYVLLVFVFFVMGNFNSDYEFIYFQF
jgi:D-alanyl-lipoteichoic acid acyltransferase DltB (MBOAT superfamily)